jgi:hypothetical protein
MNRQIAQSLIESIKPRAVYGAHNRSSDITPPPSAADATAIDEFHDSSTDSPILRPIANPQSPDESPFSNHQSLNG